jgi:hypothetical protein
MPLGPAGIVCIISVQVGLETVLRLAVGYRLKSEKMQLIGKIIVNEVDVYDQEVETENGYNQIL